MSWKRVNQLNHGIECKTVVEFRFLPGLNVKSPKYNIFHLFTTKYVHKIIIWKAQGLPQ